MKLQDMKVHENDGRENAGHQNDDQVAGHEIAPETK